jgi:hypothetical protein
MTYPKSSQVALLVLTLFSLPRQEKVVILAKLKEYYWTNTGKSQNTMKLAPNWKPDYMKMLERNQTTQEDKEKSEC